MKTEMTPLDTRLPESQKEFFQYAANLGGYLTLSEFVIVSAQSKAEEIRPSSLLQKINRSLMRS